MDLLLTVCELTLPVLVLIGLGIICRTKKVFDAKGIDGLKKLISRYLMPVTLFNSLAKIQLSGTVALLGLTCFIMCCVSLLLGLATRKICREFSYHPYLCSAYEIGMLGVALFPLLFGDTGLGFLASMDIGACFFFFCLYIPMLNGGKGDGLKQTLKNIFSGPALIACLLGVFSNITGHRPSSRCYHRHADQIHHAAHSHRRGLWLQPESKAAACCAQNLRHAVAHLHPSLPAGAAVALAVWRAG